VPNRPHAQRPPRGRLRSNALKVGDVILTTTAAKISKAVRLGTFGAISHAMVYVEDHSVIDATGDGVQARNTQRLLFEDDSPVYALRLRIAGDWPDRPLYGR